MDFQQHYQNYKALVDERLATVAADREPRSLYEPTHYILSCGGKRVRAVLVMLAAEAVGGDGPSALDAAAGVEMLHNFTLVHDDIMDRAETRRGRQTVHTRWDEGVAILVGDVLIGMAQNLVLERPPARCAQVLGAFSRGIVDVCEGQALDREFETRDDVTLDDYMHMIAMKTGRLAETAAEVGGLVGEGTDGQIEALRAYARHLGHAFQIQDDLLDITADEEVLGKRIGGDVIEGKKTYLLVRALERVREGDDRRLLERLVANKGLPAGEIGAMRDLYARHGILAEADAAVRESTARAEDHLHALPEGPARDMLAWFTRMLLNRRG
jgi:geranylgeranyl diphosphate synthase type II